MDEWIEFPSNDINKFKNKILSDPFSESTYTITIKTAPTSYTV